MARMPDGCAQFEVDVSEDLLGCKNFIPQPVGHGWLRPVADLQGGYEASGQPVV